jgi:CubicO group peptidase (beta-lactamase class C family)
MSLPRTITLTLCALVVFSGQAQADRRAAADWKTASPAEVKMDAAALQKLVTEIRAGQHGNVHSLLIVRNGKLVVEEYFTGEDEKRDGVEGAKSLGTVRFDRNTLHDMRSISKSVTSVLFGIAQAQTGKLDLDEPVLTYFPEYADLRTPERQAIKLRHLLSMTPGTQWDEFTHRYGDPRNSETAMDDAKDPYRFVLDRPIVAAPGKQFVYNGGTTMVLAAIIERATGTPLYKFAQQALFQPLGIEQHEWVHDPDGKALAASGLRLRPRDIAKIGQLYIQKGQWNGRTLVPESWVQASISPQAPDGMYGFQWWLSPENDAASPAVAVGYGGQRLLISQPLDLVVVMTAGMYRSAQQSDVTRTILRRSVGAAIAGSAGQTERRQTTSAIK